MKLLIAGSRGITDYAYFCSFMKKINPAAKYTIISGGASGVDKMAERWAKDNQIPIEVYPANWAKYGKKAGYMRNKEMVDKADVLIAIWDGKSKGTKHTIDLAEKKGISQFIIEIGINNEKELYVR